jgi:uncharacterized protein (DUF1800 family)
MLCPLLTLVVLAARHPVGPAIPPPIPSLGQESIAFDARAAEHLLNRAGFGATPEEVQAAVEAGLEATVEGLLRGSTRRGDPFFAERLSPFNHSRDERAAALARRAGQDPRDLDADRRRELQREWVRDQRREDERQLLEYTDWWVQQMLDGGDPLRDRLALYWHGYFTSSQEDVRDSFELIQLAEWLRDRGLGPFGELLDGVVRSPAMLEYLDNDENRKRRPNENFARELFELFTLGEGQFSEQDVLEAARAFTGWTDRDGQFVFRGADHDRGPKTVFGQTGNFDGDDVLRLTLAQEQCARHLAAGLLAHFEGRPATEPRLTTYAALLRASDLEIAAFLRALFQDPQFYRPEIVGDRIVGPLELLVGHARRLRVDPPARLVSSGARLLGQHLFHPPNVKGWEGDEAWITTSTLMQRGNLAGVLLGTVSIGDLLEDSDDEGAMEPDVSEPAMEDEGGPRRGAQAPPRGVQALPRGRALRELAGTERLGFRPRYFLAARLERAGAVRDGEVVDRLLDELLGVAPGPGTREELLAYLTTERTALDLREGDYRAAGADGEHLLRRLAHLILSLPEAQLQ